MEKLDQLDLKALDVDELQEIEGGFIFVFVAGFAAGVAAGVAVASLLK
ncbi:class IIb bacteriocin, lactobin A/cerein 7B family [Dyadobacter flavalbus]|uniref:Class IIb bacteriocin, lactobin A/cerein 7B family n=1 Tax=Dyadobacter flavalbus TaxID=2579942 RepID=A0A5M8QTD0_9BACT|nr:Blp family class II bacteriocin [Dyadobacter flavalbus]KAA6439389.1 class IIb bacteriocin, lactobin A/cerein 7B family [Dyadobacter flavalbus]